jgi:type I restriction enzyme M protein
MAIKKSELYSSLWKSCDELRGGMDASQYKDYVLILLFVKYVSDKYAGKTDALIDVPHGGSFKDMIALKGKPEIGDGINKIIAKLAEANDLKGVIDVADFNDSDKLGRGKDMQDRLSNLVGIFENPELDFSKNKAEGDDVLGDAYEYLMRHFATESGKSKGQFYTPAEVSRIMARVIGISQAKRQDQTVYDPTCGSGSLLLKAADETEHGITIYGQERDVATRGLAKMNMILHNNPMADIRRENTITKPQFLEKDGTLKAFDFAVANPPFSDKSWSNGINPSKDLYKRFEGFGVPPAKNGDYAFLLHLMKSLKSNGKGAIILPHGVLFRGNAEAEIRKNIVERRYIKGIIGLPPNLFYGTGIPACIIVLDKENAESRQGIFMIDASKGYMKDGNKNRLRARDIHKIVDVFNNQIELPKYSRMVPISEIKDKKNDYNLNIPRYIDSQEDEDLQDIEGHLKGGIPDRDIIALSPYWVVCPSLRNTLFEQSQRIGYSVLRIEPSEVKKTIIKNREYNCYSERTEKRFDDWQRTILPLLQDVKIGTRPKELILRLSEAALSAFSNDVLIDKYDVYQRLMEYWSETMQDDIYMIAVSGWKPEIRILRNKKGKETGWECDLAPKEIVVNKFFPREQQELENLKSEAEVNTQQIQSLEEENSAEEDLFAEARNDSGKVTKTEVQKRINQIKWNEEFADELKILREYLKLAEHETILRRSIREKELGLDRKILAKYKELLFREGEIKTLIIEEKWLKSLRELVRKEIDGISFKLTARIKLLAERYKKPLPELVREVQDDSRKVEDDLRKMGFEW